MTISQILHNDTDRSVAVTVSPEDAPKNAGETFVLSAREWAKLGERLGGELTPGDAVDEDLDVLLREAAGRTGALRCAAALLSGHDQSASALARKLTERGYSREAAEYAAAFLVKKGYLDERLFCQRYAEAAVRQKHIGPRRVRDDLLARGYDREAVREAVDAIDADDVRDALAWQAARKVKDDADAGAMRKAVAALMRQGFSAEEIREYLKGQT